MRTVIKGTGMYVPDHVIDNNRLAKVMDTSDEWVQRRTGIVTRHFAAMDQATSDMAVPAAKMAIEMSGLKKQDIDYVVFSTMTPDYYLPGAGSVFQRKFGLHDVPCLDIRQQCAGFLYGLQLADAMIRSEQRSQVLLIGAEVHACFMPWKSWDVVLGHSDKEITPEEFDWNTRFRDRAVLFGDGAGAFVLSSDVDDSRGLEDVVLHTDGSGVDKMWVKAGGSAYRPYFDPQMFKEGDTTPVLNGREVFKAAVTLLPDVVNEILTKNGYSLSDVGLFVMHQANLRINEAVQKRLSIPDHKVYNNIQSYGNTTAATLPLVFHEAAKHYALSAGALVCFATFGSGLHWGAALYRC